MPPRQAIISPMLIASSRRLRCRHADAMIFSSTLDDANNVYAALFSSLFDDIY